MRLITYISCSANTRYSPIVQVNTDLKSLINQDDSVPGGGSFSLFGFGESANDDDKSSDDDGNTSGGGDVNDTTTNEDSDAASNASENPMHIDQKVS